MIAAILRAQWLSMRRLVGRRGAAFAIVAGVMWYGIWTGAAVAAAFGTAFAEPAELHTWLPVGLLAVLAYWQLMPVLSATMGASLDIRKLLVYPVPHGKLFLIEVLLRLTSAIEMLLVLAGGWIGLAANRALGWTALPRITFAVLVFVLLNLLLSSGTRSVLERLLSRRRLREFVALLTMMIAVLPRLLLSTGHHGRSLGRAGLALQAVGLPWTAAARAMLGETEAVGLLSLAAWTCLAAAFARAQFARNLRYDAVAAQATPAAASPRRSGVMERFYRLPALVLRDPLAAVVEKELRSLARTPRFRTVFIMGFTFGLAVWFPTIASHSARPAWFLTVVSVYALILLGQVSYWNCFGFDRSAATFYFAAPQPISTVLAGKNIAALMYIYLEVAVLVGVTTALRLSSGWQNALETLVAMGVCALYLLAIGNLSSVHYPRGLAPDRAAAGGGRGMHGLLFFVYPLALVPVGFAYLARYAFDSEWIFALVLAAAAILGGAIYHMAMQSAVHTATARREEIMAELSRGEGPVVAE
jgi:ABC-2 type transport system permease protein